MNTRCRAYFYGRGVVRFAGRRCEMPAGHDGQHTCYRSGIGAPFVFRWGRAREAAPCLVCGAPIVNGTGHDAGCMAATKYDREDCGCIRRDGAVVVWCGTWERDFLRLLAGQS